MKKIFTILLSLVLISAVFSGCETKQKDILIVAPDGPPLLNIIYMATREADDEDYFSYEDYNISYEMAAGIDGLTARLAGDAAFAIAPINTCAALYNKDGSYVLGAVTSYGMMYVLSRDEGVKTAKTWDSLKGKTIHMVGFGGTPDAVIRYIIDQNEIDIAGESAEANKISLKYIDTYPLLMAEFDKDGSTVDTLLLTEPQVQAYLGKGKGLEIVMSLQDEWGKVSDSSSYPQTGLLIKKSLIDQDKAMVNAVMNAIKKSTEWTVANMGDSGDLAEGYGSTALKRGNVTAAANRMTLNFLTFPQNKAIVEEYITSLHSFNPNLVGGAIPSEGFYYTA